MEGLVLPFLGVACNGACVRTGSFTEGVTNNSVGEDLTWPLSASSAADFPITRKEEHACCQHKLQS